jgi:hypothetical protein
MFEITVKGDTLADLGARLQAAADALSATPSAKPISGTGTRVAATTSTAEKPKEEEKALVYEDDVRPFVLKLSKDHGREAALEVTLQFEDADGKPCENAKHVQTADWAKLVAAVKGAQTRLDKAKKEDVA